MRGEHLTRGKHVSIHLPSHVLQGTGEAIGTSAQLDPANMNNVLAKKIGRFPNLIESADQTMVDKAIARTSAEPNARETACKDRPSSPAISTRSAETSGPRAPQIVAVEGC